MTQESSPTSNETPPVDDQQWVQDQHAKVLHYGSRNQLDIDLLNQQQSAILPPHIAVWLAHSKSLNQEVWVITGDLPTDHINGENAKNAREAVRHFSLRWQLKADKLMESVKNGTPEMGDAERQTQFAELLISRANGLHDLADNDDIWASHPAFQN